MTATTILSDNGVSSGSAGIKTTGGNDGTLQLQTTTSGGTATTAVTIDNSQNTTLAGYLNAPNTFGFKNRIINGGMMIDQRNAGASVTNINGGVYSLDRWQLAGAAASKYTAQQSTTVPTSGFKNSLVATSLSAYTVGTNEGFTLRQNIEGFNVADLNWGTSAAATVTLSFWVRSSLTGTFGGSIINNGFDRSYPFTYTISAANTWEQKSVTIAGDQSGTWTTDNTAGIRVLFGLGVGSGQSATAGTWAAGNYQSATGAISVVGTNGATFYITGVQLEKGSTATSFDYRPYGTELALCQRYLPAISYSGSTYGGFSTGFASSTTTGRFMVALPVSARVAPTGVTVSNAGHFSNLNAGGAYVLTALAWEGGTPNSAYFTTTIGTASNTTGQAISLAVTNASANMYFTGCEL